MIICEEKECFGCAVCHDICPVGAIRMSDTTGFWRPLVDTDKCINCCQCKAACPSLMHNIRRDIPSRTHSTTCFAGWSNENKLHFDATSGGIASELAREVIRRKGIVAGVIFDGDRRIARHTVIENVEELNKIAKSKYVLSNKSDIYKSVKEGIRVGRVVLYIGTGCEINAMYHYLAIVKADLKNFYTIDLLCRGGASSKCLREHTDFVSRKKPISKVAFRGGRYDCMYTVYDQKNHLVYRSPQYEDSYFKLFMRHVLFQERCFQCPFVGTERNGDITLGDFWGLDKDVLPKNNMKGTNLIIVNSDKGRHMMNTVKNNITVFERTMDEAIMGNETLQMPTPKENEYDELWRWLRNGDFKTAVKSVYGISEWRDYIRFKFYTIRHITKENIMAILKNLRNQPRGGVKYNRKIIFVILNPNNIDIFVPRMNRKTQNRSFEFYQRCA